MARSDDYIMRNCEIRLVDGNDLYLIFFAGNAANKYLVIVVSAVNISFYLKRFETLLLIVSGTCE